MNRKPVSILQRIFSHIIMFGFCVAMPAAVMLIMPVATTTFTRTGDAVSATVVRKVFFVVPFLTETVGNVRSVDDMRVAGQRKQVTTGTSDDQKRYTRSEDMSWLVIVGDAQEARVPVSLSDIDSVRRTVRDFLDAPEQPRLRIFTVANWKISVITGGVLCLLTLAYVCGMAWGFVSLFFKKRDPLPAHRT